MQFTVDTEITVLSSECALYKTEAFIKETRRIAGVDFFLSKVAETLIVNLQNIKNIARIGEKLRPRACYTVSTAAGHNLFFCLDSQLDSKTGIGDNDIVFYKYFDSEGETRRNDQRLNAFVATNKKFQISVNSSADDILTGDLKKLFCIYNDDHVNFPLLNAEQRKIVQIEDQNVLAQGVAGSGKTNICISKIVFAACRGYSGKVLYSTFSRGLLLDVKSKVDILKRNLRAYCEQYSTGRLYFADSNYKKAVENKLGIYLVEEEKEHIAARVSRVADYLEKQVDYYLIEDLHAKYVSENHAVADESYFVKTYAQNIKNHQLKAKLDRLRRLSLEVIYKEIYGMIFGCYDPADPQPMLSAERYKELRRDSFSHRDCEILHSIAQDYAKHIQSSGMTDNNQMSRALLQAGTKISGYSLAIIDEVQDMTEVSLVLMKSIALKIFAVGDALQMINPSYFSFAYLKRLLFEKDIISVAELKNNYRNTKKITDIVERLGEINVNRFGTHSFVLKGESVDSTTPTAAVFVADKRFVDMVAQKSYHNFTVIVATQKEKESLRKLLKKQEILTISEIKGLERDVVIMLNVLSNNYDKWQDLERTMINRKNADENSAYRYYFNLFYVGVSRAKTHLYVVEERPIALFSALFEELFDKMPLASAVESFGNAVKSIEEDQDELLERIRQFINLEQYDNARFAANKISDDKERNAELVKIDVFQRYIRYGNYREAGIAYWEKNMLDEAKRQFSLSGDEILISLVDACAAGEGGGLNADIVRYLPEVAGNKTALGLIISTMQRDMRELKERSKQIQNKFRSIKENKNG